MTYSFILHNQSCHVYQYRSYTCQIPSSIITFKQAFQNLRCISLPLTIAVVLRVEVYLFQHPGTGLPAPDTQVLVVRYVEFGTRLVVFYHVKQRHRTLQQSHQGVSQVVTCMQRELVWRLLPHSCFLTVYDLKEIKFIFNYSLHEIRCLCT